MPHTFDTPRSQAAIEQLLALVTVKAYTRDQLQVAMGKSKPTVQRYLTHLQEEPRRIYVAKWIRTEGNLAPAYRAGSKKDAKRPPPPSKNFYNVRRWQRIKADPHKHALVLAQHRLYAARDRLKKNPNTWLSALLPGPVGAIPRTPPRRRAEHAEQ
jgi:hypothetical protein